MDGERRVIGITGGIGSGKSVVARILRLRGFEVYDCDYEAKLLMATEPLLIKQIKSLVGESAYHGHNQLNKEYLASVIFNEADVRKEINNLVHSAVRNDIHTRLKKFKGEFFFIESAIIFSSGLNRLCDSVWMVSSPIELRRRHLLKHRKMKSEDIEKRIESQVKEFNDFKHSNLKELKNNGRESLLQMIENLLHFNDN